MVQQLPQGYKIGQPTSNPDKEVLSPRNSNPFQEQRIVLYTDIVQIRATSLALYSGAESSERQARGFQTDGQISGRDQVAERELQRWHPEVREKTTKN